MLKQGCQLGCLLIALSLGAPILAADKGGLYALRGAGFARCEHFLRAHSAKEKEWFVFYGWIDGYINALNEKEEDTFDAAPWQSTELLAEVIRRSCADKPAQSFFGVVRGVTDALRDFRLRTAEERLVVELNDQTALVYPDTLRRLQTALARLGFFSGAVNGQFGPDTEASIKAFQASKQIPATGLPGPVTLWALLVEEQP